MITTMLKTCLRCKATFSFPVAEGTFACPFCGALNGRPASRGDALMALNRATEQRLACDFRNAEITYQQLLREAPSEHEALWGLALCRYGVEYVTDPRTGERRPTVHGVRRKPMKRDHNYIAACKYAPPEVCAQYEADAKYVDDVMASLREAGSKYPAFDVFICHKTSVPGSKNRTEDCFRGLSLYGSLERAGYHAFFAPEEMQRVIAGADYEAGIYHALDTAKVMVLICSQKDWLESSWVRSEWTRFLEMLESRDDKCLLPLFYGDFTAGDLPQEIQDWRIQGIRMEDIEAKESFFRVVEEFCGERNPSVPVSVPEQPAPAAKPEPRAKQPAPAAKPEPKAKQPAPAVKPELRAKQPAPAAKPEARVEQPAPAAKPEARVEQPVTIQPRTKESDFETEQTPGGCRITKFKGWGGDVTVPATIRGEKVVGVGTLAFAWHEGLRKVTLPAGVKVIGEHAFSRCGELAEVVLPNGVERIERGAFYHCTALKSINIPHSVKRIDANAFENCEALRSIRLPVGVEVDEKAFAGCMNLRLEYRQTKPAEPVYSPAADFETKAVSGGYSITKYRGADTAVHIPPSIRGLPVVSIGESAFEGNKSLVSVTVPEGVCSIENYAFSGCGALHDVKLPDTLKSIGDIVFNSCHALESITIPPNVNTVGINPFCLCSKLRRIVVAEGNRRLEIVDDMLLDKRMGRLICCPADLGLKSCTVSGSVKQIGAFAFDSCQALEDISIPSSVKEIGRCAFQWCRSLTACALPGGLKRIPNSLFSWCSSLRSVEIPYGVESIEDWAFNNCAALERVNIPDTVTAIWDRAFNNCAVLSSLGVPESVKRIGEAAFAGCKVLKEIVLPAGIQLEKDAFDSHTKITYRGRAAKKTPKPAANGGQPKPTAAPAEPVYAPAADFETAQVPGGCSITRYRGADTAVHIPPSIRGLPVVTIGSCAFGNNESLVSVTVPEGVRSIESLAFAVCSALQDVKLPDTLKSIGADVFSSCWTLESITIPRNVDTVGSNPFSLCSKLRRIVVAEGNETLEIVDGMLLDKRLGRLICCPVGLELKEISIPSSIKEIGYWAFGFYKTLERVTIPNTVKVVGCFAFSECGALSTLTLPRGVRLDMNAFEGCDALPFAMKVRLKLQGAM